MFQAYVIVCSVNGKCYIGITGRTLMCRLREHFSYARRMPRGSALYAAIRKYGESAFTIAPVCSAQSWDDLCAIESVLILQWGSLSPSGYNLEAGGKGRRKGFKPSPESIERSAAKHRGIPCHPNTRKAGLATKGRINSPEHNARISASKLGKPRSKETKDKLRTYWKRRRADGAFKTARPYEHSKSAERILEVPA